MENQHTYYAQLKHIGRGSFYFDILKKVGDDLEAVDIFRTDCTYYSTASKRARAYLERMWKEQ